MADPLRAPEPEASPPHAAPGPDAASGDVSMAELVRRAREHAEAEAAVAAVMRREDEKAAKSDEIEHRKRSTPPIRIILLLALLAFNAYLWFAKPVWLSDRGPDAPEPQYYAASWKIAVFLERQRIEEYRHEHGRIPATAQQAGQPVDGVKYTPIEQKDYRLEAGDGAKHVVFTSTDSLSVLMGRTLVQMGLVAGGMR